ncbi:MAG: hypothetical protein K9J17_06045 [Flavobacteriales bacterium]|nr:hypothetical protein [Flavobacteriales bacterium]
MKHVMGRSLILFSIVIALVSGCTKDEIIIDDNTAPPDSTISALVIKNYVTKCYISLLGREPHAQEQQDGIALLDANNLSVASRKSMLEDIMDNQEYLDKVLEINSLKLLNGPFDTSAVQEQLYLYNLIILDPQYADFVDIIQEGIDNLEVLLTTPTEFRNGTIGMQEMQRRLVYNEIYDQINMGSYNYVLSLFNNFLFRDPTEDEHNSGITMVDGFVAVLFYQTGNSKEAFIDIFLHSDDYYEGQVRELYQRYLFREPSSEEQSYHSTRYKESSDYERLQEDILSSDEFAGL